MSVTDTILNKAIELTKQHFGSNDIKHMLSVAQILSINNATEKITKALDDLTAMLLILK
jgi:hypothetical protein